MDLVSETATARRSPPSECWCPLGRLWLVSFQLSTQRPATVVSNVTGHSSQCVYRLSVVCVLAAIGERLRLDRTLCGMPSIGKLVYVYSTVWVRRTVNYSTFSCNCVVHSEQWKVRPLLTSSGPVVEGELRDIHIHTIHLHVWLIDWLTDLGGQRGRQWRLLSDAGIASRYEWLSCFICWPVARRPAKYTPDPAMGKVSVGLHSVNVDVNVQCNCTCNVTESKNSLYYVVCSSRSDLESWTVGRAQWWWYRIGLGHSIVYGEMISFKVGLFGNCNMAQMQKKTKNLTKP